MKLKIKVSGLKKSFGDKKVLSGIDFEVYDGEILCIIGKSGTGKSVILKHLIGLLIPDEGTITVDGIEFTGADEKTSEKILSRYGILFQGAALFDSMNIFDNVAFGMRRKLFTEDEIREAVPRLLEEVGLRGIENKRSSELSGGMQKRVGLARSIAVKPEIMLYDEPTTGVDPITGASVDRLIKKMNETHKITSIVVTHDMKSAYRIADRIIMIYEGKKIFSGTVEEIKNTGDPVIRQFIEGRANGPIRVY